MKQIEKLTPEQEALIPIVKNEWIDRLNKCLPTDRSAARIGIEWLYGFCKLKKPLTLFLSSPLGMQIAANLLKAQVWAQVWDQVRDQVGDKVRDQVGSQVGSQVGAQVWDQVGSQVGAQVWDQVGSQVWAQVWDQVRDQVGDKVRDQVGSQVWAQVWDQVRDQVGDQVGDQVRDQVGSQVGAQVWDQVWAQVRDQVRDQVGDQVGDQIRATQLSWFDIAYYGCLLWDAGWVSFYDFFIRAGLRLVDSFLEFKKLTEANIFMSIQLDGLCLISEMPTEIHRNNEQRLHSTTGAAIKWADGYEQRYMWGVSFPIDLHEKLIKRQLSAKDVLKIKNMEQRMAALKFLGAEAVLEALDSKSINKSKRGNELFEVKGLGEEVNFCVKYTCLSTGRIYVSFVDPAVGKEKSADKAMAWKFGLDSKQYESLEIES